MSTTSRRLRRVHAAKAPATIGPSSASGMKSGSIQKSALPADPERAVRPSGGRLAVREKALDLVVQRARLGDEVAGRLARAFDQVAVRAQAREAQVR